MELWLHPPCSPDATGAEGGESLPRAAQSVGAIPLCETFEEYAALALAKLRGEEGLGSTLTRNPDPLAIAKLRGLTLGPGGGAGGGAAGEAGRGAEGGEGGSGGEGDEASRGSHLAAPASEQGSSLTALYAEVAWREPSLHAFVALCGL